MDALETTPRHACETPPTTEALRCLPRDDAIVSDELNHPSIIDGARLSRATIKVFPHGDADAARKILSDLPAAQRKLLITDGVFSMDGDLGPLPALCDAAEAYGAIMMVDDAHASGVFGRNGRGTVDHFEMHGRVDVQVGDEVAVVCCVCSRWEDAWLHGVSG